MKQKMTRNYKYIYASTVLLFLIFFISVNAVETYYTNKKILLFVNGYEDFGDGEIQKLKVNSIAYGIWNEEDNTYVTEDKYILMKMKSRKVILSTNNIKEIIDYTNKE